MSLARTANIAIIPHHFEQKNRAPALGLMILSYPAGLVVFPVVANYIYTTFGFSKGMLIIAPFQAIHILCSIFHSQPINTDLPNSNQQVKTWSSVFESARVLLGNLEVCYKRQLR